MTYQIKLDSFEGPLDLLLHLIEKEEMDIYDIQISKIADQYMDYINAMQSLKLEVTSEFVVMAATLLAIKSRMLLPVYDPVDIDFEIDEEDPRELLINRLIEYKKYKELSLELREMEIARSKVFTRPQTNLSQYISQEEGNPVNGISIYHLVDAFERALKKFSYKEPLTRIEREEISVKDMIKQITNYLTNNNGIIHFSELADQCRSKSEVIITFLSILELIRQGTIYCVQNSIFDEIVIHNVVYKGVDKVELQ